MLMFSMELYDYCATIVSKLSIRSIRNTI